MFGKSVLAKKDWKSTAFIWNDSKFCGACYAALLMLVLPFNILLAETTYTGTAD